jgi:hypothetical protein
VSHGKVSVYDTGSLRTHVADVLTVSIVNTLYWYAGEAIPYVRTRFVLDPVNGNLYMCYLGVGIDGVTSISNRIYVIDRTSSAYVRLYMNKTIEGDLERIGSQDLMWTAFHGNRQWEAGAWATDGYIKQYAHAE